MVTYTQTYRHSFTQRHRPPLKKKSVHSLILLLRRLRRYQLTPISQLACPPSDNISFNIVVVLPAFFIDPFYVVVVKKAFFYDKHEIHNPHTLFSCILFDSCRARMKESLR